MVAVLVAAAGPKIDQRSMNGNTPGMLYPQEPYMVAVLGGCSPGGPKIDQYHMHGIHPG